MLDRLRWKIVRCAIESCHPAIFRWRDYYWFLEALSFSTSFNDFIINRLAFKESRENFHWWTFLAIFRTAGIEIIIFVCIHIPFLQSSTLCIVFCYFYFYFYFDKFNFSLVWKSIFGFSIFIYSKNLILCKIFPRCAYQKFIEKFIFE